MPIKTEDREIDGVRYRVSQLGAVTGSHVFARTMKVLGPALAALADSVGAGRSAKGLPADLDLAAVVAKLEIGPEDLDYFRTVFAEKTFVFQADGKMPRLDNVFDDHFAGRYLAWLRWLGFCLEVNFADFFRGLADAKKRAGDAPEVSPAAPSSSPSPSPSTSTGASGGS